ncbi:MAG: hypothetical protein O2798_00170 [Chloroflexi bacterium]|nr:hypothetical protein [Chloroflexota bacterium]
MAENDVPPASRSKWIGVRGTARYLLALSVPIAALVIWWFGGLEICDSRGATPVCALMSPTSVPALAGLLLVALLLFPDLSEATVAQVFSVRRRVASQEQRLDSQEARLAQLFAMTNSSNASVVNNIGFLQPGEPQKVEAQLPPSFLPNVAQNLASHSVEERKLALIELNERLTRLAGAVRAGDVRLPEDWILADFQGIVDVVRRARNNVAHGIPIDDHDVRRAIAMGRALERTVRPDRS